jgi:RimJ/RimL family protein N-acetyltransferase
MTADVAELRESLYAPLATPRLLLEPLTTQHAAEMTTVLADPALYAFTGGEPPTPDELLRRYQRQVEGPASQDQVWANWIIRDRETGLAAGYVQATLGRHDGEWTALLGWLVGTQFQRRGFAVTAVTEVVRHLESCGIVRFQAHIANGHTASVAVATRLGLMATDSFDDEGERIYVR